MTAMNIDTPNSGKLAVESDRIIEFPVGLAGFESCRRFTLFHPETVGKVPPSYFILQSLDDPMIAFNIADPALFGFSYEIKLSDTESAALDLADPADAAVVVVLAKDEPTNGDGTLRANLQAPLVLNLRARRGIQHVFARLNYQVTLKSPE
ncbi:MAG: flagellar assembly protein FliW [Rhodocyclaceae bacterium]|jgi:flagellar assembly factor FliW|nr:flagellar assembly protein FliW [Rhodocyclaceae bacterium]